MKNAFFAAILAVMALIIPNQISAKKSQLPEPPTGAQILAMAREAAGGDGWANAKTLTLSGHAVFYGDNGPAPRSTATDYRMWRIFDANRQAAHGADGKVRIVAKNGEKLLFEVGYDGDNMDRTRHHPESGS